MLKIYHNNRCSKSRETLAIIEEQVKEFEVFPYLEEAVPAQELRFILEKLGIAPLALIRKGEQIFKDNFKGKTLSDEEWIQVMLANPKLIERPIVINGDKVVIGRPPSKVLEII
ncbi:arsenate reductase (glutaredoxin) [Putridiphycobacter roseus]|uniref:Arsenate reductase (Glutaredoxin) n=1 Tax=Putridiphycobacter roseus TaxID=2219161 RepID=A0A2W1MYR6_9FLAO|nr:arsenate reductase (glutaredoxin) [Putridiphycobacter roseus]PZE16370.1 arsenate reductase (glutaredoxin) [Putridiphycobacter roseus]